MIEISLTNYLILLDETRTSNISIIKNFVFSTITIRSTKFSIYLLLISSNKWKFIDWLNYAIFFFSLRMFFAKFDFKTRRRLKTYSWFIIFQKRFDQWKHYIRRKNFEIRYVRWNHCNIHISKTKCCNVQKKFANAFKHIFVIV